MPRRQFFSRHQMSSYSDFTERLRDYRSVILNDGPLAYYTLNETSGTTAVDLVAAKNGTYTGSYTLGVTGVVGTAVDWTGGYLNSIPSAGHTGDWSVEMWINPDSLASGDHRAFWTYPSGGPIAGARLNGSNIEFINNAGSAWQSLGTTGMITVGAWHQIVFTRTGGSTLRAYVNGTQGSTTSTHSNEVLNFSMEFFRAYLGSFGVNLNGKAQQVSLWGKTLSAAQITNHYNVAISG